MVRACGDRRQPGTWPCAGCTRCGSSWAPLSADDARADLDDRPSFTPTFRPAASSVLGGYGTHWVPSLSLDELCGMLWDMIRYRNFDVDSPYNREAALWAKTQTRFEISARRPSDPGPHREREAIGNRPARRVAAPVLLHARPAIREEVLIIEAGGEEVIDAEIVPSEEQEIVFLD